MDGARIISKAAMRAKKWRERNISSLGDNVYRRREAVRVKTFRCNKHVEKMKSMAKKQRKPQKKTKSSPPAAAIVNKPAVSINDNIYACKDENKFKECSTKQSHLVFHHPFTCLVAGPTCSGKTVFTRKLLENRDEMIEPNISEIIWCYGVVSPQLAELKQRFPNLIRMHKGLPDMDRLSSSGGSKTNRLIVLDDLMNETKGSTVSNLFTKGAHHLNISVIYITQNMFFQKGEMRTIFLNSHYKVIFNNKGDMSQLTNLNTKMFPGKPQFLKSVMRSISERSSYPYIVFDIHPKTPLDLIVRSCVFPGEENNVYLPE